MKTKKKAFLAFLLLALSMSVFSQVRTGILTGRIADDQGEPLPGVSVTIKSPAMIGGAQSGVTNERGIYRFINLPPGVYELKAELQGFTPYAQADIRVRLGLTAMVDINLKPGGLNTEIQVVAKTPVVDIESNKLSSNFTSEVLAKLPSKRDLEAFLKMTPSMIVDFGADPKYPERASLGSGTKENYYSMDGTYLTDPGNGQQMIFWNYDIIDEAQVEGAGHEAQYGNAAGAVINVVTKSGGDKFSGLLNVFYRDKSMSSENFQGTGLSASTNAIKSEFELSANLGGPVIKEKLWFFLSGNLMPTVTETVGFPAEINRRQKGFFGKLTSQLNRKNKLSLLFNYSRDYTDHMFASQFYTPESTLNSLQWTAALNFQWSYVINANALLDVRGGYIDRATTYDANSPGASYYEMTTGMNTNSYGFKNTQTRRRYQLQSSLSYWLEGFGGDHDLKAGFEFEQGEQGANVTRQTDYEGGPSTIYTMSGEPYMLIYYSPTHYDPNQIMKAFSGYVQDTWKVGKKLNINAGFRINHVEDIIPVQTSVPKKIKDGNFTNFEPRLGLVYDLSSKNRQMAIKAHYGRYYLNSIAMGLLNSNANSYFVYLVDGDQQILIDQGGPGAVGVDPDLRRPYSDSVILGLETSLGNNLAFKVNGIYKATRDFIGEIDSNKTEDWYTPVQVLNPISNEMMTVYDWKPGYPVTTFTYYTNPSQAKRNYKGLEFVLERKLANNYQFMLSYTLSRASGTALMSTWSSAGMVSTGTWNNPNNLLFSNGVMDLDKPHVIKFNGVYYAPLGVIVGLSYQGQSGTPYSRSFRVNLPQMGATTFPGEKRGSQRTPFQHMIDVRVEKSFQMKAIRASLFLEAFNLLNSNTALTVGSNTSIPSTYGKITAILPPRTLRLGFGASF